MKLVSLLLGVLVAAGCIACQPQPALDTFGRAPDFQLTDQTGATFASQSLGGKVTLLDFVYTHCTDACPLLSATFQEAQRKLSSDGLLGSRIMLVSLSVDPVHDTPVVLAEYGQQFKADPAGWKLLTGDFEAWRTFLHPTQRALAEKPVAGVNGVGAAAAGGVQDPLDVEIGLAGRWRTEHDRLAGLPHVRGVHVGLGVHGHRREPEVAAGAEHAPGDLAAIGDQDLAHQGGLSVTSTVTMRQPASVGAQRSCSTWRPRAPASASFTMRCCPMRATPITSTRSNGAARRA